MATGMEENQDNPGIGTTSPNYKLDVNGNINATSYRSNGIDYAENFEKLNVSEIIEAGDVVAVVGGKITKPGNIWNGTPALYMVVTDSAGVIGGGGSGMPVAFTGRVKTKVSGTATQGDYILAGNSSAGYAKPKPNTTFDEFKNSVVGIALESKGNTGTGRILVAVGVK